MWDQFADHMYINTQPPAALRIGDTPEHHHFLVTQREMRSPDLLREVRLWGTSAGTWGWQLPPTESIRANRTPHPLKLLPLKIKNNHDPQVLHSSFYEVRPIFSFPKHEVSPLSLHRTPPPSALMLTGISTSCAQRGPHSSVASAEPMLLLGLQELHLEAGLKIQ